MTRLVTIALALALGVSACAPNTQGTGGATDAPLVPQSFVYVVPGVATTLDPAIFQGDPSRWTIWDQRSSLVVYDTPKLKGSGCEQLATVKDIRGELAESWSLGSDGKTYTFKLRSAKSQYGNTLSSADVLWSAQRHREMSAVSRTMFDVNARYEKEFIKIIDDRTFELKTINATSLDLAIHTIGPFALNIYDSVEAKKHTTAADPWAKDWLANNTANYGPWQVESFKPGAEVVYVPNPNYWGKRGNISKVTVRPIPESSTRSQLLQAGEADFAARLSFDEYSQLKGKSETVVQECLSPNRDTIMLQEADKRFADKRVRKAISLAVDRSALINGVYRGFARPSETGLPGGYAAPSSGEKIRYDQAEAKRLLAEAGYPNGFSATLTISPTRPGPHAEQLAILIKDQLARVGIDFKIEVIASSSDFATRYAQKRYEAMLYLDPPAVADPLYTLNNYAFSTSAQNTFGYANPEYDRLTTEIGKQLEPGAARDRLLRDIDKIIMDDTPIVYLVDRTYLNAYRSNIKNYQGAPHGELLWSELTKVR